MKKSDFVVGDELCLDVNHGRFCMYDGYQLIVHPLQ